MILKRRHNCRLFYFVPMRTLSLLLGVALISSCAYNSGEDIVGPEPCQDTTGAISFANDIQLIMNGSCGGQNTACHGQGNPTGVDLYDYNGVYNQTLFDNPLVSSITHDGNYNEMPKGGGKLSDCKINLISAWINRGAQNN